MAEISDSMWPASSCSLRVPLERGKRVFIETEQLSDDTRKHLKTKTVLTLNAILKLTHRATATRSPRFCCSHSLNLVLKRVVNLTLVNGKQKSPS